jgi:type IV secretory pathway component VirB8
MAKLKMNNIEGWERFHSSIVDAADANLVMHKTSNEILKELSNSNLAAHERIRELNSQANRLWLSIILLNIVTMLLALAIIYL